MSNLKDTDIEDLFRRASEKYPLRTDSADWDRMAAALEKDPPQPPDGEEITDRRRKRRFLWLLLLLPLAGAGYYALQGHGKGSIAAGAAATATVGTGNAGTGTAAATVGTGTAKATVGTENTAAATNGNAGIKNGDPAAAGTAGAKPAGTAAITAGGPALNGTVTSTAAGVTSAGAAVTTASGSEGAATAANRRGKAAFMTGGTANSGSGQRGRDVAKDRTGLRSGDVANSGRGLQDRDVAKDGSKLQSGSALQGGDAAKNGTELQGATALQNGNEPWRVRGAQLAFIPRDYFLAAPVKAPVTEAVKDSSHSKKKEKQTIAKHFYAGILGSPDISTVKMQAVKGTGSTFGLLLGYSFNRRWSIETGVYADRKHYYTDGEYFDTKNIYTQPNWKLVDANGVCYMWEIPLNVRYNFNPGAGTAWFATAGFSTYLMSQQKYVYNWESGSYGWNSNADVKTHSQYPFSIINLSVGFEQRLGKVGSLRLEPFVRLPLTGVGTGKLPIMSAGVNIGITRQLW